MIPLLAAQADRARAVLDVDVHNYLDGGAGEEITLAEAATAWRQFRLRPSVLRDVRTVDTGVELLGTSLGSPIVAGPTASHHLAHRDGEIETARGVRAAGGLLTVSTRAGRPIETIAAELDGPWWFQVYLTRERAAIHGLIERAVANGARALVLTGDTPYVGRKKRAGRPARLDSDAALVNLGRYLPPGADPNHALEQDPGATERDIATLAERSGLPVLVKGVLRADDAKRCVAAGASGIVVSNHGGRQLDRAVSTAHALPEVVAAVGGSVPVLVDGGLRSGMDVALALALGADAVLLGRPVLWALAAGGADGVRDALTAMTDDLAHCLALLGVTRCADLDPSYLSGAPS